MMWRRRKEGAAGDDAPAVSALEDLDFDLSAFDDSAPADAPVFGPLAPLGIPDPEPAVLADAVEVRVRVEPRYGGRRAVTVDAQYSTADSRREALLAAVLVLLEDLRGRPL